MGKRTRPTTLAEIAQAMVAPGTSIIAAHGSQETMRTRFETVGLTYTPEAVAAFRTALLTTPHLGRVAAAVILDADTLEMRIGNRTAVEHLTRLGIIPGVKVDLGTAQFPLHPGELLTRGLDDLPVRLTTHKAQGVKFAMARSVYTIGDETPSSIVRTAHAHWQTMYALMCQEAGLVPIVTQKVQATGEHDMEACADATERVLFEFFEILETSGVRLNELILRPNMVTPGLERRLWPPAGTIAETTISVFDWAGVPEIAGIAFLSNGMSPHLLTQCLSAINRLGGPCEHMSASFGRASQDEALLTWARTGGDVEATQLVFMQRLERISAARNGYNPDPINL